jgi:hypothetical protein
VPFPRMLLVFALAALALCAPVGALAAQTYNDTVSGFEYFATSTEGRFAGTASGALPGNWNADVQHTPLCVSCTPTATITGGSFLLASVLGSSPTVITSTFIGGSVQVLNVGANCTNQTFAVNGALGSVGPWLGGSGNGTFTATLTHYRHSIFGRCITYGASVAGTLTLTF